MSENIENQTLRLLQEMRKDMNKGFEDLNTRVDGLTLMMGNMFGYIQQHDGRITKLEDTVK